MSGKASRRAISDQEITQVAVDIGAELGLRAVTARAVAAALGISAQDVEEAIPAPLPELAVDAMLAEFSYQPNDLDGWRPDLLRFAEAYRQHLSLNLWAVAAIRTDFSAPGLAGVAETFFEIVTRGFAQPKRAARLLLALLSFTHGWVLTMPDAATHPRRGSSPHAGPASSAAATALEAGFSLLAEHAESLAQAGNERDFRAGVEALIGA